MKQEHTFLQALCRSALLLLLTSTCAAAQDVAKFPFRADTAEGTCKPGVLDEDGRWDCRIVETQIFCPPGTLGTISDEVLAIVSDGKPLKILERLVAENISKKGLSQTINWLQCQGFNITLNTDFRASTRSKEVMSKITAHVWLRGNSAGRLDDLLRTWQATKDAPHCIFWVLCEYPGELSIKVEFDERGYVVSTDSHFHTEGL